MPRLSREHYDIAVKISEAVESLFLEAWGEPTQNTSGQGFDCNQISFTYEIAEDLSIGFYGASKNSFANKGFSMPWMPCRDPSALTPNHPNTKRNFHWFNRDLLLEDRAMKNIIEDVVLHVRRIMGVDNPFYRLLYWQAKDMIGYQDVAAPKQSDYEYVRQTIELRKQQIEDESKMLAESLGVGE